MKNQNLPKPVWIIIEPFFFIHSVGYMRAILQDKYARDNYELVYIYGESGVETSSLVEELQLEAEDSINFVKVGMSHCLPLGRIARILLRSWRVMRVANKLASKHNAKAISILRVDDLILLLAIPGMQSCFSNIRSQATGVFFNSRCFREGSITMRLLSRTVRRVLQRGFFKKVLFLDHGVCGTVRSCLNTEAKNIVGEAIDPWTSGPEFEYQSQITDDSRTTLLTFGAHSGRKGTLDLLKMFRDYPLELKSFKLLIAGPIRDDIEEEFAGLMAEIDNSSEKIECVDKYISDKDSWRYFLRSQIVLCPYVDFHGSSNVTIRAAAVGVPVVAPIFGFLGEVVEHNKIGATYKNQEPAAILDAVIEVQRKLNSDAQEIKENCKRYARFHNASRYVYSLLALTK